MVFSSAIFLLLFLPVVFVVNYFIQRFRIKISNVWLLFASWFFYAWGEPFLMIALIIINWLVGKAIEKSEGNRKKVILAVGILCDLGVLGYYKYTGFIISIVNNLFRKEMLVDPKIVLPIGISFFTFQAISYIVDVYRGSGASQKFINVALYISFFPQLIAGPIIKWKDINKQIENRRITELGLETGFKRFVYGLGKKVLISNVLGQCVDTIYAYDINLLDGRAAWLGALAYTFQLYYDFSGYSDMACGLGKMFGFNFPENFNYPYLSKSISEFWRRWHITLGSWFKEYVYIPLGGNRKGTIKTYINLLIVFFLTGLWHGASMSFVIWGLYHGFFSVIERLRFSKVLEKSRIVSAIYCFMVVNFGWVIFRANNMSVALRYILRMIIPWHYKASMAPWNYMDYKTIFVIICAVIGIGFLKSFPRKWIDAWNGSVVESMYCFVLLILSLASIASNTYNPFIYFQF